MLARAREGAKLRPSPPSTSMIISNISRNECAANAAKCCWKLSYCDDLCHLLCVSYTERQREREKINEWMLRIFLLKSVRVFKPEPLCRSPVATFCVSMSTIIVYTLVNKLLTRIFMEQRDEKISIMNISGQGKKIVWICLFIFERHHVPDTHI